MAAGLATLMLICALVLHNDCKLWKVIQRLLSLSSTRGNLDWDWAGPGLEVWNYKELSPLPIL